MEKRWGELLPQYPFEYTYVDDAIENMYRAEERMASLFKVFTIVAILIACWACLPWPLLRLSDAPGRSVYVKPWGLWKHRLQLLMVRDFSLYVLISLLIALPSIWFIARWWLNEFSYRIDLNIRDFLTHSPGNHA